MSDRAQSSSRSNASPERPLPEGSERTVVRARIRDARKARREYEAARGASELQETGARDLGSFLGVEIDPMTVRDTGLHEGYHGVLVRWGKIKFRGSYRWGGRDWRYGLCGHWKARRRWRLFSRELWSVADLGRWV